MYRYGTKRQRRPVRLIIGLVALFTVLIVAAVFFGRGLFKSDTQLKQGTAVTSKVTYTNATKHYDEPLFGIDIPSAWQPVPKPVGPYNIYGWQTSVGGTDGQLLQVYQDTIPVNFAVNRALIVEGQGDHVELKGSASDNCADFTKGLSTTPNLVGARARWQNVDFLCDQANTTRDVIGTSSPDGINLVILKATGGTPHKYLFSYTNQGINPDYSLFYNAVASFRMK